MCVARNGAGQIVSVNTTYVSNFKSETDRYYIYRMFTREQDRHLHLVSAMMHRAVDTLRQGAHQVGGIQG